MKLRRIIPLAVFSCAILFTRVAIGQHISPEEFASQFRLAEVYEQTRSFDDAIRVYEYLYHVDSTNEEVFDNLVHDYLYVKRYADAEQMVKSHLAGHEDDMNLLLILARVEAKMDKRSQAMDAFHKAETSVHGDDCLQLIPIASALAEVNYADDAMEILKRVTKDDNLECAGAAANLYLQMGKYGDATKEYLILLDAGEGNLSFVEQRIAQFTTDSASRSMTLESLKEAIQTDKPTLPGLELLIWMYTEEKQYDRAFAIVMQVDSMNNVARLGNQGFELLSFAEKARNEGALDVAVKAYDEAIRRIKSGPDMQGGYFLAQAELGALRTTEAYLNQKPNATKEEIASLVSRYEEYGSRTTYADFGLQALIYAASISTTKLLDLNRAASDYQLIITKSHGYNDRMKTALFGLVDLSIQNGNFPEAAERLVSIEDLLAKRMNNPTARNEDKEALMHSLYERALIDYYQGNFDSSLAKFRVIIQDPTSDYANDAIGLASTISENKKLQFAGALALFAKANLAEVEHDQNTALGAYQTILVTYATAPLADQAALHAANIQIALGKDSDAVQTLETMQEKLPSSPILDEAAFREAEIVEQRLHDKKRAETMYEDFLARFPKSTFDDAARERARKLRGDVF